MVVSHPGEFLRSSSTAKLAPLLLPNMEGDTCELLAYGTISHASRLTEAIAQAGPHIRVLFPGPPHLTDTVPAALAATAAAATAATAAAATAATAAAAASLNKSEGGEGEGGGGGPSAAPPPPETAAAVMALGDAVRDAVGDAVRDAVRDAVGDVDLPPLTVLVPDGAWQSARVLALELLRMVGSALGGAGGGGGARFVGLAGLRVAAHTSAVMEMLRQGAGRGRRALRKK